MRMGAPPTRRHKLGQLRVGRADDSNPSAGLRLRLTKVAEGEELGGLLFDLPDPMPVDDEVVVKAPTLPLWTAAKARLISRYIYYFEMITHHGTYIDGFAGPQSE